MRKIGNTSVPTWSRNCNRQRRVGEKDYTIPASKLNGDVGNVRIAIEVNPGAADLYFDDFSGVKETALPKK